jgi:hypothetical protein
MQSAILIAKVGFDESLPKTVFHQNQLWDFLI